MDISLLNQAVSHLTSAPAEAASPAAKPAEANPNDVQRFAELLNPQEAPAANPAPAAEHPAQANTMGDRILGGLQGVSDKIHTQWEQVGQVLDSPSHDTKDMLKAQAKMLEIAVEYEAVGKLVTRTSKNIEDLVKTQ